MSIQYAPMYQPTHCKEINLKNIVQINYKNSNDSLNKVRTTTPKRAPEGDIHRRVTERYHSKYCEW